MSEATPKPAGMPLHTKTLIGLGLGLGLGILANVTVTQIPALADYVSWLTFTTNIIGRLFLRLMFMVVVPLVFSALALAVIEIGDTSKLGRMGLRTLGYTAILSITAVVIGILLVNFLQPGNSISKETRERLIKQFQKPTEAKDKPADPDKAIEAEKNPVPAKPAKPAGETSDAIIEKAKAAKPLDQIIIDLIPENPLQEMIGAVDGSSKGHGMLAVMVFALVCGLAVTSQPERCQTFVGWLQGLQAIAGAVIDFAMRIAPIGAGCLVFTVAAKLGFEILVTLLWFVLTALLGLALHLFGTYSLLTAAAGKVGPRRFFRDVSEAMLVAFSTSSSSATLPTAIKVAQNELKLPPRVSNFVLTVGATGNQNGTALYEGVVILFLAQVMGVDLTLGQQLQVVLMAVLAGIGTAGVPGGSLPLIVVVMQSVGVPGESIGLILGVDRLLDMCRTVVNVTGDLAIANCVARGEPESA